MLKKTIQSLTKILLLTTFIISPLFGMQQKKVASPTISNKSLINQPDDTLIHISSFLDQKSYFELLKTCTETNKIKDYERLIEMTGDIEKLQKKFKLMYKAKYKTNPLKVSPCLLHTPLIDLIRTFMTYRSTTRIQTLYFGWTPFKDVSELASIDSATGKPLLENLKKLSINGMNSTDLRPLIPLAGQLEELSLYHYGHQKIRELLTQKKEDGQTSVFSNLKILRIRHNDLTFDPESFEFLASFPKLKTIDFQQNLLHLRKKQELAAQLKGIKLIF